MLDSACSSRCSQRWRDQGEGCRWEREWSWCPVGQRGRGPHGAEAPDQRTQERAGLRRAEAGGNSCQSPGSGRPQKAQEAGWGVSWSLPCLPLIPTAPAGSVGVPLTARDRARGLGGRLGRGQGARDRSAPGGGTGGRQRQKGPEARVGSPGRERACTSLLAEPPGGDQPLNPRIEVPVAAGPPFVRNSIRWQSRY